MLGLYWIRVAHDKLQRGQLEEAYIKRYTELRDILLHKIHVKVNIVKNLEIKSYIVTIIFT